MRRVTSRVVSILLAAVSLVLVVLLVQLSEKHKQLVARADTLYGQAKLLEQQALESRQLADSLNRRFGDLSLHPIHPLYIAQLRNRGLEDPVADLVADLRSHPEIISERGFHGERMGFHEIGRIRILSEKWVYAPFDDGHIGGESVFEYSVTKDGKISWREVVSRSN